jgi:hypothetical protein
LLGQLAQLHQERLVIVGFKKMGRLPRDPSPSGFAESLHSRHLCGLVHGKLTQEIPHKRSSVRWRSQVTKSKRHLRYFRILPTNTLECDEMLANRVLLVDDDEIVRMAVTVVLKQIGFSVTCAASVVEALKHIS